MLILFNSKSEVNTIHLIFAKKLGLPIKLTDVGDQKIDGNMLDTHEIIVAVFSLTNKANQVGFVEKTFLVANINLKRVFGILFLILSNVNVDFLD